ncbi:tetratricopeptide repeat protein [Longirhabdus pacifica]|uniref:tetratricopeptide repeat protein n=1 Tax=Longirhabdus pacifica TaxID=2305227 RepID=UPI0010087800|nr:hypothetical protein [Longirhabdus pacifica]
MSVNYDQASQAEKDWIKRQYDCIASLGDSIHTQWQDLNHKLLYMKQMLESNSAQNETSEVLQPEQNQTPPSDLLYQLDRGQGYFKLKMFHEAIQQLEPYVKEHGHFIPAKLMLAISYFQSKKLDEAYEQFKQITKLSDDKQITSFSYNAMGCVEAHKQNLDQACDFFKTAHHLNPDMEEPLINIGVCMNNEGDTTDIQPKMNP